MSADEDATMVSDCPLAAIQIQDGTGIKPLHPMQIMQQAYGLKESTDSK